MVPSEAIARDLFEQMGHLVENSRYLAAHDILIKVQGALTSEEVDEPVKACLRELFDSNHKMVEKLKVRHKEVLETLHYQDADQKWTVGAHMFGITTSYQYDQSDHSLIIKLEGVMEELPLFEQCAVINEVELFPTWLPFCREGVTVDRLGKADIIPYDPFVYSILVARSYISL